jgi:hypothetical protein
MHRKHFLFLRPAGDGGSDTGGADRGDDWTPNDDDPAVLAAQTAAKDAETAAAKAKADETKATADAAAAAKAKADEVAADKAKEDEGKIEGEDDADPDKTKAETRKDTRIPVSRHKEILDKERAARADVERKLAAYEKGSEVGAINADIKKDEDQVLVLDKEYSKLITDGEHEKAAGVMREIRTLERGIADRKADMKAAAAYSQAVEKTRYDTVVERLEMAYPLLNPDDELHDPERTQDVLDLAATYRARRGMTPAEAIQKAAKTLLGQSTKKQEAATTVLPRADKEEAEELAAKALKEEERKKAQVKKNLEASRTQAPDTSRAGMDADRAGGGTVTGKDIMKMNYDEFSKLDEKTLSEARGDNFVGA